MTTQMSNVIPGSNASTGGAAMVYQCAGAPVAAVNDVQTITVDSCTHSTLTLTGLPGGLNYTAAQDVVPEELEDALNVLLGTDGDVRVTGTYAAGSGGTYIFTWGADFGGQPIGVLGVSAVFVGGSSPAVANVHGTPGVRGTYGGVAPKGALLADVTNAALYQNTGTQLVPVWTAAPSGANPSVTTLAVSGLTTLGLISQLALNAGTVPTYNSGGTTTVDPATGSFFVITTATGNSNVAFASSPAAGQVVVLLINNDSGGARTLTFTTHAKAAATLVGTASKACVWVGISDGTNVYEVGRAGAATATAGL